MANWKILDRTSGLGKRADSVIPDDLRILKMLQWPSGKVDVVIDTDTYNEIDDQFAIAYALRSPEKIDVKALYAAPFYNDRSESPADGMERSYHEIKRILELIGPTESSPEVFRGSDTYLAEEDPKPVLSDAAKDLLERSKAYDADHPLYVIAIGAITNVASAILMDSSITQRIVVIWLGGHSYDWDNTHEFNMMQDVTASRVVFDSRVPVVLLPCAGIVSGFLTSKPELEYWLRGKNALCDYLLDITVEEAEAYSSLPTWTRAIWDVTAVAWLVSPDFMADRVDYSPIDEYDDQYAFSRTRHLLRYVYSIRRDELFLDLFTKLAK